MLRRLLFLILFLIASYKSWPFVENKIINSEFGAVYNNVKSAINGLQENPIYLSAINSFFVGIHDLLAQPDQTPKDKQIVEKEFEKPVLESPLNQTFSVYNLELGSTKAEVEKTAGKEKRSSLNEYGVKWYTYHEDYKNFFMTAYDDNNRVVGIYTNQDLISSAIGIKRGSTRDIVRGGLGNPLTEIQKGNVYYKIEKNQDYDVYLKDGSFITIFYDKHQNNTVTAIQMISEKAEQTKPDFYTTPSPQLMEGFEYQLFDLTNATRVNHGLSILTWDVHVRGTAREHSSDMAENQYFDHTNQKGQSPFDRMQEDDVVFTFAGENLAYGQLSSIFAHEGLMNSLGHRENILRNEFEFLGVGVAFNDQSQPYYTQNFFAN